MYETLLDVPEDIRRFYHEVETRYVVGYDEELEQPIYDTKQEVELNAPPKVTYEDVTNKRGRRFSEDIVKDVLEQAIAWEDFDINHNQYLEWKVAYEEWELNLPQVEEENAEGEMVWVTLPAPVQPVVDISTRREVYKEFLSEYDTNTLVPTGETTTTYNDETYVKTLYVTTKLRPDVEIMEYHQRVAKVTREELVGADLEFFDEVWQVGTADRENMRDAIEIAGILELPEDTLQNWILEDNTVRPSTVRDLQLVLAEYGLRKQAIYREYIQWRAGDMLTPFEYNV